MAPRSGAGRPPPSSGASASASDAGEGGTPGVGSTVATTTRPKRRAKYGQVSWTTTTRAPRWGAMRRLPAGQAGVEAGRGSASPVRVEGVRGRRARGARAPPGWPRSSGARSRDRASSACCRTRGRGRRARARDPRRLGLEQGDALRERRGRAGCPATKRASPSERRSGVPATARDRGRSAPAGRPPGAAASWPGLDLDRVRIVERRGQALDPDALAARPPRRAP